MTLLFSCRLDLAVPSRWQASAQHSCYPPHGVGMATRKTCLASLPVANPDQLHLESLGPQIEVPAEVHTRKQERKKLRGKVQTIKNEVIGTFIYGWIGILQDNKNL